MTIELCDGDGGDIGTLRPTPGSFEEEVRELATAGGPTGAATAHLGWLDPMGVARLGRELLGAPPSTRLLEWIRTSDGDPGLIRALLEGLLDEDRIRVKDGHAWTMPGDRGHPPVPYRVHALVRTMLDEVGAQCRQMLRIAAVLGPGVDPDGIARALGQSTAALLPAWEEALASGLLVSDGHELAFARELVRQAVAESLPTAIRDALRGRQEPGAPAPDDGPAGTETQEAPASAGRVLAKNTARERTVLSLVAQGFSNRRIARTLGISDHSVKRHVSNLLIKHDCANRTELALLAVRERWNELPLEA